MVNLSLKGIKKFDFEPTIILLFVFGGLAEFSNKIYQKYALSDYKSVFLFFIFFVAFFISVGYARKKKAKVTKKDVLTGFAVGIPNLFSSFFLILSLDTLTTSVAFPLFSAGSILLITLGGYFIFKERISNKNKLAIGLIIVALILLNL
jgi:multidrug transporter EmrE-like cation transporter